MGKVVSSYAVVASSSPAEVALIFTIHWCSGVLPVRVGGATSQLDLLSLTPFSVAGCG